MLQFIFPFRGTAKVQVLSFLVFGFPALSESFGETAEVEREVIRGFCSAGEEYESG